MNLDFIKTLSEGSTKIRIPHPEDAIFDGVESAQKYLDGLKNAIVNPEKISIKWDGGIALFFGNDQNGNFGISDKYMPAKGVFPKSPAEWVAYDKKRGSNREDLYGKIAQIWDGLKYACDGSIGLFKGDLMSAGKLAPAGGTYTFSPTTVEYHVLGNSEFGRLLKNSVGIVAVHQFKDAPWDGKTGMVNGGDVTILNPTAGISFELEEPVRLIKDADKALHYNGDSAQQFMNKLGSGALAAIKKYFNQKITEQTDEELVIWLKRNVSGAAYTKLVGIDESGILYTDQDGYMSLRDIWNAIYLLKVNLVYQLEPQIVGFSQTVNGQRGGEGFVYDDPVCGLVKLVNRGMFGVAHFAK